MIAEKSIEPYLLSVNSLKRRSCHYLPDGVMPNYIALIHKHVDSCYGVSFPDWPGVITAGDTIDEAMQQATEVLHFAAEDWENPDGTRGIPRPRTIDDLRADPGFRDDAVDAVIAAVPFQGKAEAAE
jgi:antitoxin HicB